MEKQDNRTAENLKSNIGMQIAMLLHSGKDEQKVIDHIFNLATEYASDCLAVQEQSKQEVTGKTWDDILTDFVCEHDQIKPYTLLQKWLEKNYNHLLSLPQEQKDKVTGVSDEEINDIALGYAKSEYDHYPEGNDKNGRLACSKIDFANGMRKMRSLLSSKAVEQKEPDGWRVADGFIFGDKSEALDYAKVYNHPDPKPIFFPYQPIQEAEHKQGVTDEKIKTILVKFLLGNEEYRSDQVIKDLRSLFGEKGKEGNK